MNATELQLNKMNTGRMVNLALQELGPLLDEQKKTTLSRLTQDFRAGKRAEDLYAHIAVLVAIEDIETNARSKIRQGEAAAKDLNAKS